MHCLSQKNASHIIMLASHILKPWLDLNWFVSYYRWAFSLRIWIYALPWHMLIRCLSYHLGLTISMKCTHALTWETRMNCSPPTVVLGCIRLWDHSSLSYYLEGLRTPVWWTHYFATNTLLSIKTFCPALLSDKNSTLKSLQLAPASVTALIK